MNIVILDGYTANPGDLSWKEMEALGHLTVYSRTAATEVVVRAANAEIVLLNKVKITSEIMAQLPKLKYIGVLATGYNVVDVDYAHEHGIVVSNIPAYSTESVVQMTFAHILNITNQVGHYADEVRLGKWSAHQDFCYWDTPIGELTGKTFGIVGLGHIGMRVATIARNFGMDVFALTSKETSMLPDGIQKTTLEGLLSVSDFLSLHCPLTPETNKLINADRLKRMKPGAILINTGRGQLVDEKAVAEALESGQLLGYGADVMTLEPPSKNNPLLRHPHAYFTPHIAWASKEARMRLVDIATQNVQAFMEGHAQNRV
ncbi:lactate dehydrogenase-like oxidoreductase [Prevotella dentalis DSM 3688]|uniref:Glycerate dehydrogenase n=1 Tax=Prevotella dentalis (strain ATCC 49559 / DSM 3688 / JCM 13448 / NCTC 12043 / ES 2772) TaxID=908937 RepID=F9D050_PREDD|nr:D-2-hydroxyacid dehydrogenase [Prevotella dentalis]AGB27909.1 lactate dehydrogenase-like oxidoreductase [Prevotella dentalis DSM 3688]EGQ17286.1 glycerate dehydrogenase [Prevotella dentalis DSM 3688]